MRTTTDIPDSIYEDLKKQAAEERTTIKALLDQAARLLLRERRTQKNRGKMERMPWPTIGSLDSPKIDPVKNDFAVFGDLDSLGRQPLGSVSETGTSQKRSIAEGGTAFPSLVANTKNIMVSKSLRIPLTMSEELADLCREHGITEESQLIRDCIQVGIRRLRATGR